MLLTKLLVGEITTTETATLMGLSERQVSRLKAAFERAPDRRQLSTATAAEPRRVGCPTR